MAVAFVEEGTTQKLSIHMLSIQKICRYFSLQEATAELADLIEKVVDLYNKSLTGKYSKHYSEIRDIDQPGWPVQEFEPFRIRIYAQINETHSRLSSWIEGLGTEQQLGVRRVHYVFFLYRVWALEKKTIKEIFALTTGFGWQVVQKFCDFRFPIQLVKRLMEPLQYRAEKRPMVGDVVLLSEVFKEGSEVSESDAVDKLFTRVKLKFRTTASIYHLPCFKTKQGTPLIRGMGAEIGLGLIRLSKELAPASYPEVLNHFSKIALREKTERYDDKTVETDSDKFDYLEYFKPVDFTIALQLKHALIQKIADFIYRDADLPPLDFCYKGRSEYFQANQFTLFYKDKELEKWGFPPSTKQVMTVVKNVIKEKKLAEENLAETLKDFRITFEHHEKKEPILECLEGEVRIKKGGEVYWRLHTMWYQIHADYLGLVHQEFRNLLAKRLLSPEKLPLLWPSPADKAKRKQELGKKKYDLENEYNQRYLDIEGFFLGDKVTPQGIELFDLLRVEDDALYLFHVKEGIDHHARDACSQILNAAKLLHTKKLKGKTDIVAQFYQRALEGGDAYRSKVKDRTGKVSLEVFQGYFDRKIVFVYACVDKSKEKRLLSSEREIKSAVTAEDLEEAHDKFKGKGDELLEELIQEGYLSKRGQLISKFLGASKDSFEFKSLPVKAQRAALYQCLSNFKTKFDSTIVKLELISLKKELRELGYKFKILQIFRTDYGDDVEQSTPVVGLDPHFEMDDLAEIKESEMEEIREDLKERKSFTVEKDEGEEVNYFISPTIGDGACGLHALLGKKNNNGQYQASKPRTRFKEALIAQKDQIVDLWEQWMCVALKDFLSPNPSRYTKMMFQPLEQDIVELRRQLADSDQRTQDAKETQSQLFTQATELDEYQDDLSQKIGFPLGDLKQYPQRMNNKFRASLDEVISTLNGTQVGNLLAANRDAINTLEEEREGLITAFVKQKKVWDAYLQCVMKAGYYFSNQELGIAARLFNKRIVIYTHLHLDRVIEGLIEGDEAHPEVVIFHKGVHYSRCDLIVKT